MYPQNEIILVTPQEKSSKYTVATNSDSVASEPGESVEASSSSDCKTSNWLMKADCVKTGPGRNNCTCRSGSVGDGTYCYPSTPCLNDAHCDENAVCLPSTPGQVTTMPLRRRITIQ